MTRPAVDLDTYPWCDTCAKELFPTRERAQRMLGRYRQRGGRAGRDPTTVYRCPTERDRGNDGWHLASRTARRQQRGRP